MSTTWKVIIAVVVGFFLLAGGTCVAGYLWIDKNADKLKAEAERIQAEAGEFAAAHEQHECIAESMRKSDGCEGGALGGAMCRGMVSAFMQECLRQARESPGLCDGVPAPDAILELSKWSVERCVQMGRAGDQPCAQLISKIAVHCAVYYETVTGTVAD